MVSQIHFAHGNTPLPLWVRRPPTRNQAELSSSSIYIVQRELPARSFFHKDRKGGQTNDRSAPGGPLFKRLHTFRSSGTQATQAVTQHARPDAQNLSLICRVRNNRPKSVHGSFSYLLNNISHRFSPHAIKYLHHDRTSLWTLHLNCLFRRTSRPRSRQRITFTSLSQLFS
jgi:hypothetical protein